MNTKISWYKVTNQTFIYVVPAMINPDQVTLINENNQTELKFSYSAKYDVRVSLFFNVTEIESVIYNITSDFKTNQKHGYEHHFVGREGTNQVVQFKLGKSCEELFERNLDLEDEFIHIRPFHLIIRLEPNEFRHRFVNLYYFRISMETPDEPKATLVKHKVEIKNQSYTMNQIYGPTMEDKDIELTEIKDKCVVCMEQRIEVIIMYCRHTCLCLECANKILKISLDENNKQKTECPLCKEPIKRMISIQGLMGKDEEMPL